MTNSVTSNLMLLLSNTNYCNNNSSSNNSNNSNNNTTNSNSLTKHDTMILLKKLEEITKINEFLPILSIWLEKSIVEMNVKSSHGQDLVGESELELILQLKKSIDILSFCMSELYPLAKVYLNNGISNNGISSNNGGISSLSPSNSNSSSKHDNNTHNINTNNNNYNSSNNMNNTNVLIVSAGNCLQVRT